MDVGWIRFCLLHESVKMSSRLTTKLILFPFINLDMFIKHTAGSWHKGLLPKTEATFWFFTYLYLKRINLHNLCLLKISKIGVLLICLFHFWPMPKIIKINWICEQPSKVVSLFGPTCTCTNTTALLLIADIFVTAQTALYHCTIASYHCTFCVSFTAQYFMPCSFHFSYRTR